MASNRRKAGSGFAMDSKIWSLTQVEPQFADPEDEGNDEQTTAANLLRDSKVLDSVTDDANGYEFADIKKSSRRNIADLSELSGTRYSGRKVSRKELEEEDDQEDEDDEIYSEEAEDEDAEESGEELDDDDVKDQAEDAESDYESGDSQIDGEEGESDQEDDEDDEDQSETDEQNDKTLETQIPIISKKSTANEESDLQKALALKNQLAIWDSLLDARIKIQKVLHAANRLPPPDVAPRFLRNPAYAQSVNTATQEVERCLHNMHQVESILSLEHFDTEDGQQQNGTKRSLEDLEAESEQRFKKFLPERNATLTKWYRKTKWMALNSKVKGARQSMLSGEEAETIVTQITNVLADRDRLFKKCHIRLSKEPIFGRRQHQSSGAEQSRADQDDLNQEEKEGFDFETYEDDEFYHKLLRELISSKMRDQTTTGSGGQDTTVSASKKFTAVQRLRSKMRRNVDTKASKGRRLRYDVHTAMVNFMAPQYAETFMEEDAKDQLFASLFGQTPSSSSSMAQNGFFFSHHHEQDQQEVTS